MSRYVVQKTEGPDGDTAWLSIPEDGNSAGAVFLSDRAQATEFRIEATARLWAWDTGAICVECDE